MGETMWAVVVEEDQPLKLGDVEKPSCGPNDVLVEVMTAGLIRADLVQRKGLLAQLGAQVKRALRRAYGEYKQHRNLMSCCVPCTSSSSRILIQSLEHSN